MQQKNNGFWWIIGTILLIAFIIHFWKFFTIIGLILAIYFFNKSQYIHFNFLNHDNPSSKHTGRKIINWLIVFLMSIFIIGSGSSNSKKVTHATDKVTYIHKNKKPDYQKEKQKQVALLAQKEKLEQEKKEQEEKETSKKDSTETKLDNSTSTNKTTTSQTTAKNNSVNNTSHSYNTSATVAAAKHTTQPVSKRPTTSNTQDTRVVYITQTGNRYHFSSGCRSLRRSRNLRTMTVTQATAQGYTACGLE